jgi:hypothetical protein
MARDGDERVRHWSCRQCRSQRPCNERGEDPPRKEEPKARGERPSRNTSQPRSHHNGVKVRGNRENQDLQRREHHGEEAPRQNDSKSRSCRP